MNLKKYLPFENYTLTSKLPVDEIKRRLADNIEPKKNLRFPGINKISTGHTKAKFWRTHSQ